MLDGSSTKLETPLIEEDEEDGDGWVGRDDCRVNGTGLVALLRMTRSILAASCESVDPWDGVL